MSGAPAESIARLADYLASVSRPLPLELGERVQRAVLQREAERLVARLEALSSGELGWLDLGEAWQVLELARSATRVRELRCSIRCNRLRATDEAGASETLETLRRWADASPLNLKASLLLHFDSELDLTRDPAALGLALSAAEHGWDVEVGSRAEGKELVAVEMRSEIETVSLSAVESDRGTSSIVRFGSFGSSFPGSHSADTFDSGSGRRLVVPAERISASAPAPVAAEAPRSIADLFGERIMLRDIEPRDRSLEGIDSFREELGWDEIYVPRKNEPEYAQALIRIIGGSRGRPPERIVYVGDTLLNDGNAIKGLQEVGPAGRVWGFLCGATQAAPPEDFMLGRIYFGRDWRSLRSFVAEAESDGLSFDEGTWVLFDLDQTVYAAKGSADESLLRARWDAVRGYLSAIVPAYKLDPERAEKLYREFDRDSYHPVTRDNMDYVVLLVLAVVSGLADAAEIHDYAGGGRPGIAALAEELQHRASIRLGHEDVGSVLEEIKAVHYNTLAGDQTPCKEFRRYECEAMAARMGGENGDGPEERILLNREAVALIDRVKGTGARLLAVSDRPLEAAVVDFEPDEGPALDLMTIPMALGS
jgi:hypothetical protein